MINTKNLAKEVQKLESQKEPFRLATLEKKVSDLDTRTAAEQEFWHDMAHELKSHFKREERRHRREARRDGFIVISLCMTIVYTVYVADSKTPEGLVNLVLNLVRGSI